jgi:hypothetical protein
MEGFNTLISQSVFRGIGTLEDLFHSFFCGLITLDQIQVKTQNDHPQREQFGEQEPRLLGGLKSLQKHSPAPLAFCQSCLGSTLPNTLFFLARDVR